MTDSISVRDLYERLDHLIADEFGEETWIHGEVRNYAVAASGHAYFDLADPDDDDARNAPALKITLFKYARREVMATLERHGGSVELATGVLVRIRGQVGAYRPRSSIQLRMTGIDPTFTIGAVEQERERVLAILSAEGLLGVNGTRPLAELPLRVALVTSKGSAAHADTLHELQRWQVPFHVLEVDARTQGPGSAESLVAGLRTADRSAADVVLLVRGGGARTDLVAFDDEAVAREVTRMRTPVFTGVGHEIDRTVVDDVAHTACKTPTAAAAAVGERARGALDRFEDLADRLPDAARRLVDDAEDRLVRAAGRAGRAAAAQLDRADLRLEHAVARTGPAARRVLEVQSGRVELVAARVAAHDPALALARGWSTTRRADGSVVRSVTDVAPGERLVTLVADGEISSVVTDD